MPAGDNYKWRGAKEPPGSGASTPGTNYLWRGAKEPEGAAPTGGGLFLGSQAITSVSLGDRPVLAIYRGSQLVWPPP